MTDVVGWWCGVLAMEIVNYRAGLIIGTALQISVWQFSRTFDFQSTNDKRMLTKYFAKVSVKFNPTHRSARLARMFLASIPPSARGDVQVSQKVLNEQSGDKPEISVTYKDGKNITLDPTTVKTTYDMVQAFDQYSRSLKIQDDISDN
uniref:Large ribosomal subunit protein mL53 n=1 Tax=Blastobotrys adeninivorans TaxID=409370 RepID=A0A060T7Y0_BLAAD